MPNTVQFLLIRRVVLITICFCELLSAQIQRPLWKTDLRNSGYAVPTDWRQKSYLTLVDSNVFFVNDQTLAVTYLTPNVHRGLTTRNIAGAEYVVTTAMIDATSGKVLIAKSWGNFTAPFAIQPAASDRIAVLGREGIDLYSSSLEEIAHVQHQPDTVATDGRGLPAKYFGQDANVVLWKLSSSPDRKSLIVKHAGFDTEVVRRLDSATLSTLGEWKGSFGVSDGNHDALVFRQGAGLRDFFCIGRTPDSCDVKLPLDGCGPAKFVVEDRVILTRCSRPTVFNVRGEKIASLELGSHLLGENVAVAPDGRGFAIYTYNLKGGSALRDVGPSVVDEHILVYSAPDLTRTFDLPVGMHNVQLGYALSPSGERLVVLRDGELTLYRLK